MIGNDRAPEHYYLVSESIEGVRNKLPILRAPDNCAYVREEAGKAEHDHRFTQPAFACASLETSYSLILPGSLY